jgi:hypothetical protein
MSRTGDTQRACYEPYDVTRGTAMYSLHWQEQARPYWVIHRVRATSHATWAMYFPHWQEQAMPYFSRMSLQDKNTCDMQL